MTHLARLAMRLYLIRRPLRAAGADGFVYRDRFVDTFTGNPENPFLVSFPRTGSHWLRLLMELYFEKPNLVRTFHFPHRSDFLVRHVHDMDLALERRNVIYLYRDPVATVFSQLSYHHEDVDDLSRIGHWALLYGRHLEKWLVSETFTTHKTIVRYEAMRNDMERAFAPLCRHFGQMLDRDRLNHAAGKVTRSEVKSHTAHDPMVVSTNPDYGDERTRFTSRHGPLVRSMILAINAELESWIAPLTE